MSGVYVKPVQIKSVIVTSIEKSKALEDPLRAAMLELLSHKAMSIEDIVKELKKLRYNKAPTTIRHHLELLKKAGLVELTRIEDVKGGSLKYYASTARLIRHETPADFDDVFKDGIETLSKELLRLYSKIIQENSKKIDALAKKLRPCPYCNPTHFREFILFEILNKAVAELCQKKQFQRLLEAK